MRTTVVLDDELVKKAKKRAVELKIPLRELINQALRDFFSKPPPEQKPPQSDDVGEGCLRSSQADGRRLTGECSRQG
jgi:putative antitoxin of VapBC-like toxin-antitoxin system